jgi:membrane protein YqaA with SNARE-associated domain
MGSFSRWIVILCASPAGVIVLAALDSTLFVSLPFGIDAAVVLLAARLKGTWWIVPPIATAGSVAGAALTFWMGMKIGDQGLERWVSPKRLTRIRAQVRERGAVALAVLDLIPPPFPFTPFVLAAGALDVSARMFFVTLTVCRMLRFGLEAALALAYGPRIMSWLDSNLFHGIVMACIAIAAALTALSLTQVIRATRVSSKRTRAAA